jgi:hypothetical protein
MKKIILMLSLLAFVTVAYAGEGCPFAKDKPACTVKDKAACAAKKAEGCSTNKTDSAKESDQKADSGNKPAESGKN